MKPLTESEKRKFQRTAYVALDAVDRLVSHGLGGDKTERALENIRGLITDIELAPLKVRSHNEHVR